MSGLAPSRIGCVVPTLGRSECDSVEDSMSTTGLEKQVPLADSSERIEFATKPSAYKHWKLSLDGPVATLALDVNEQAGLMPGYELKLNSYDPGLDIELYDAVQRLRHQRHGGRWRLRAGAGLRAHHAGGRRLHHSFTPRTTPLGCAARHRRTHQAGG